MKRLSLSLQGGELKLFVFFLLRSTAKQFPAPKHNDMMRAALRKCCKNVEVFSLSEDCDLAGRSFSLQGKKEGKTLPVTHREVP
jgi:hypothetical protein